jgi:hypothetical protein
MNPSRNEPEKPDHHEYEKTSRKGRLNHKWRDKKRLTQDQGKGKRGRHNDEDEDYDDE